MNKTTVNLAGNELAPVLSERFPGSIAESVAAYVVINGEFFIQVMDYLKNSPEFGLEYLADITAIDYMDYFELNYRLGAFEKNISLTVKLRCYERSQPEVPSVVSLWKGADYMEREINDLMGIYFQGHPNMKRLFLWEGFQGHPLRKDYI